MKPDERILSPLRIAKMPGDFLKKMQRVAYGPLQKCAVDHEIARRNGRRYATLSTPMAIDATNSLMTTICSNPFIAGYAAEAMSRRSERGDGYGD